MSAHDTPPRRPVLGVLALLFAALVAAFIGYRLFLSPASEPVDGSGHEAAVGDGVEVSCTIPEGVTNPVVDIQLASGHVCIELRPDLAPQHVERMVALAGEHFYDGIVFHRVIDGFMAQTGDPTGTGMGGSELPDLPAEFTTSASFERGTLGMARSQSPDSANSQFFIMFAPAPHLDGQYTIFGQVYEGMEHVDAIKRGAGGNGMVAEPDRMITLRVVPAE